MDIMSELKVEFYDFCKQHPNCNDCKYHNKDNCNVEYLRDNYKHEVKQIENKTNDETVNHPIYYQGKIEVIDFIEDKYLGFHLGNVIKYISRAGKKDVDNELEDLKKAQWYLNRYIELKEGEKIND